MDERDFELAADLAAHAKDEALASVRANLHDTIPEGFDGNCVDPDCGIPIPTARLLLGRIRCIECQERKERALRRW